MVDAFSVDRFLPHADPAPWAGYTRVASGRVSRLVCSDRYSWRAMNSGLSPWPPCRSGRPTSPMNRVSPVSTPYGASAPGDSHTTMQTDSGVCPGVARNSRLTWPSWMRSPSATLRCGKCTSAASP